MGPEQLTFHQVLPRFLYVLGRAKRATLKLIHSSPSVTARNLGLKSHPTEIFVRIE